MALWRTSLASTLSHPSCSTWHTWSMDCARASAVCGTVSPLEFGSSNRANRARPALWVRKRMSWISRAAKRFWGARLDERSVHDRARIRINTALTRLECISGRHVPRRGPLERWTPRSHRTLVREVRCRPPKRGSRLPTRLAPDGGAPRTRESHPSAAGTLDTRAVRPCAGWWLVTTPLLEATRPTSARRSGRAT